MIRLRGKLAVVDIETTGVNPLRHDPLAVAIVPYSSKRMPLLVYVKQSGQLEWSDQARVNFRRFKHDWEDRAVSPTVAVSRIEEYLQETFDGEDVTLAGHNIGFDVAFLRKLAFSAGKDEISHVSHRHVDTHSLLYLLNALEWIPNAALTSSGAFDHFGIAMAAEDRHTALGDALATERLLRAILREFDTINERARCSHTSSG